MSGALLPVWGRKAALPHLRRGVILHTGHSGTNTRTEERRADAGWGIGDLLTQQVRKAPTGGFVNHSSLTRQFPR